MAVHESDREDLLRETTALKRRLELQSGSFADPVVAGLRDNGALSIYFGPECAYHFDGSGRLKRAYVAGRLYRTQGTTLAELTRSRTARETQLWRADLTPGQLAEFLSQAGQRISQLRRVLAEEEFDSVVCVPAGDRIVPDVLSAIESIEAGGIHLAAPFAGRG